MPDHLESLEAVPGNPACCRDRVSVHEGGQGVARAPFLVVFKAPRADSHGPGRRPLLCPGESRAGPWGEGQGAPIRPDSARPGLGAGSPVSFSLQGPGGGGGDGLGAASAFSSRTAEGLAPPRRFFALVHLTPAPPAPGPRAGPPGALRAACRCGQCFSRLRPPLHAAGPGCQPEAPAAPSLPPGGAASLPSQLA